MQFDHLKRREVMTLLGRRGGLAARSAGTAAGDACDWDADRVSVLHGAPLRLRCENELGFKMVKWIAAIGFVHDFADLRAGQGGYNEDHEFYGYRMPI